MQSPMRVLAVDDDPVTRSVVQRALEQAGYVVETAPTGAEGINAWQARHHDIVVTDWVMPGASGVELCRLIREASQEEYTYIIMLTGRDAPEEVRAGLRAGADDYVTKPWHPEELVLRVNVGARVLQLQADLRARVVELEQALARVKTLEGLLPICAYCKKIRNDDGYWAEIEAYIEAHTDALFTHGLCPDCLRKEVLPQLEELQRRSKG